MLQTVQAAFNWLFTNHILFKSHYMEVDKSILIEFYIKDVYNSIEIHPDGDVITLERGADFAYANAFSYAKFKESILFNHKIH